LLFLNSRNSKISSDSSGSILDNLRRKPLVIAGIAALAVLYGCDKYESSTEASESGITIEIIYDTTDDDTMAQESPKPELIDTPTTSEVNQISSLNIGTYNAWWKKESSKKSINDVLTIMRGTANTPPVDILGVQEFKGQNEPEKFKEQVPLCETCEFNAYIPDSDADALPIIWKPLKVTATSAETIFLHPKVEADGTNVASRWVNIVYFVDKASGEQFGLANTHFVHGTQDGNELNLDNPKRLGLLGSELGGFVPKVEEIKLTGIPVFATYDANMSADSTNSASPKNILKDLGFIDGHDADVIDYTPQEQGTHDDRDIDFVSAHPGLYEKKVKLIGSWTLGNSMIKLKSDHDAFVVEVGFVESVKNG
jgi:hypothetical protein